MLLGFGFGEGSGLLLVHELLFLQNLIFSFDSGRVLNSVEVILADDYRVILVVLFSFHADRAKLVHSNVSC